jgi:hypothetical protein
MWRCVFESCKVNKVCLITGIVRWFPVICLLILFNSCNQSSPDRSVERGFYFWKSKLRLTDPETTALEQLQVKKLYVKFFDVVAAEDGAGPSPVARIEMDSSSLQALSTKDVAIIPVVFITNETLQPLDSAGLIQLAENILRLLNRSSESKKLIPYQELQIDCDWTTTTKSQYFFLLQRIREHMRASGFFKHSLLSATIRLHQVKYSSKSGIPPIDRGLLMCYNMGNLKNPATGNSILDNDELKKYLSGLQNYPLQLDIALPVFSWYVFYRNNTYRGIVSKFPENELISTTGFWQKNRFTFQKDTVINEIAFLQNDQLRLEENTNDELLQATESILEKLSPNNKHFTVSFYHLDPLLLTKHPIHELEAIYRRFR